MTALVGIRCSDGVVIASDSSATFGPSFSRTIEQETSKKVEIIGNTHRFIVAGTGFVGHHQRFVEAVREAHGNNRFNGKTDVDVAKQLATVGIQDFLPTTPGNRNNEFPYSALVAYQVKQQPCLCELDGNAGFQSEVKRIDDLWFSSMGSGQSITDPFLALFRQIFWKSGPPDVKGGIFTAYWALKQACDFNPGGINYPIHVAVLAKNGNSSLDAWMLDDNQLAEHIDAVEAASEYFGKFKDVLRGSSAVPPPAA